MPAPTPAEYAAMHAPYVAHVQGDDILEVLRQQKELIAGLAALVPPEREQHRYAPGKWSIREVLGHITDGERIFAYRALCVARGEQQSLPGFDENEYAATSTADSRPLRDHIDELLALRDANIAMLRGFDEAAWSRKGIANGNPITARGVAYVLAGHFLHHLGILRERYGVAGGATAPAKAVAPPLAGA